VRVWIDLDNSPHVHFFAPLIAALGQRGIETALTVRSHAQTEELARSYGMDFTVVGRHPVSTHLVLRVSSTFSRALQLAKFVRRHRPVIAMSHGSRALTLAAWAMRIPAMMFFDYEHSSQSLINLPSRTLVPAVIPREMFRIGDDKLARYPGFKEEVYIYDLNPDRTVLPRLEIDPEQLIITLRPPATWAHYQDPLSDRLLRSLVDRLRRERNAQVIVLPRTPEQATALKSAYNMAEPPFRILDHAVDALSLMWYSDAVFSGGGTMVREAALLGVPTFSIFGGKLGAADDALVHQGKLRLVRDPRELASLQLAKVSLRPSHPTGSTATRDFIIREIVQFLRAHSHTALPEVHTRSA
jgi:predicted glycosyltransferase